MCKVVHVNKESYDVYIGRPSKWGNPFTHIADKETLAAFIVSSRYEALIKYKEYLLNNEDLMSSIMELDGKILGCWCITDSDNPPYPFECHGQIIQSIITNLKLKNVLRNTRKSI